MYGILSRPFPKGFFGEASKKCLALGVNYERFQQFGHFVDAFFAANTSIPAQKMNSHKTLRDFVKKAEDETKQDIGIEQESLSKAQFDACIDMMKEAGFLKQVGNSLLQSKKFFKP
jgi:hypothetical protein